MKEVGKNRKRNATNVVFNERLKPTDQESSAGFVLRKSIVTLRRELRLFLDQLKQACLRECAMAVRLCSRSV